MKTFKAIFFRQDGIEPIDELAYLKFLEQVRKEFEIPELTTVEPLLYSGLLSDLVNEFQGYEGTLTFSSFKAIEDDQKGLHALTASKLRFLFLDFPLLNRESILAVLQYIKLNRELGKKNKQKRNIKSTGNTKNNASDSKTLLSLKNKKNIEARKFISTKLDGFKVQEINYSMLAKSLNEAGFETAKGAKFHAKSVERVVEKIRELRGRFEPNLEYENQNAGANLKNCGITGIKNEADFEETLNFEIKNPQEKDFEVILKDNTKEVFRKRYDKNTRFVSIDLDEHYLLPGRYYLKVIFEKMEEVVNNIPIYIYLRRKSFEI